MVKKSLLVFTALTLLTSTAAFADGRREDYRGHDRGRDHGYSRHEVHHKYFVRHSPYFRRIQVIERPVYISSYPAAGTLVPMLPPGTVLIYQNGIPYYYSYAEQVYYTASPYGGFTVCHPPMAFGY